MGKQIVEQEQQGKKRAEYGKQIIKLASEELTKEFGKGFSERTLRQFRQFYTMFPDIFMNLANSVRQIHENTFHLLSWSHIQRIMRIKNPTVLEFLGLPAHKGYTENTLKQAIIDQMQHFLLELGKGFAFVARQQLIRTETQDFYIDLVFYNYMLKCFVIVELKTNKITHQDIGQLDMYVRMYDDLKKPAGDNPTIGILLCTETDNTIARYSVLKENKQLFASKYMPYLPTEGELQAEIERQKELLAHLDITDFAGKSIFSKE